MAQILKKTTGLTGLAVEKYPHQTLQHIYAKVLHVLSKMPATSAYRKHTEQVVNEKISILKQYPDIETAEQKLNCGQLEEVIIQAKNELKCAKQMVSYRVWEPLVEQPPPNQWTWPPHN